MTFEQSHPLDLAARMYPDAEPPRGSGTDAPAHFTPRTTEQLAEALEQQRAAPAVQTAGEDRTSAADPAPRDERQAQARTEADVLQTIAEGVPTEIQAERAANVTEAETVFPDHVDPAVQRWVDGTPGLGRAERKAIGAEWSRIAVRDIGLTSDDVAAMVAAAKGAQGISSGSAQQGTATALLAAFQTPERAQAAFAAAQKLVQRDPRVVRLLEQTGLGNHPETIVRIAQAALRKEARR